MTKAQPGPGKYFVSHNYGDEAALAACVRRRMPDGLEPFMFPAMSVTPDQAISSSLIEAISACGAFVYLDTPLSRGSFWVGFERNIAARLGKSVYAFRPRRLLFPFPRDRRPAVDPIVAVLFNLAVPADVERIQAVREAIWQRYRFEIRGDKWRRLDNDARQMLDSIDGLREKYAAGGVTLLFLSNESLTCGYHDYADPYTFRRAQKDMETPAGHTAEKFAAIDPSRTVTLWLDRPHDAAIEAALVRFDETRWGPYLSVVRRALAEPVRLLAFQDDGALDLNHLDTMLARALAAAIDTDARLAEEFRGRIIAAR